MTWLRAAPIPTAVVIAPSVRLNRPVPRVRSGITSTDTTPKIPAPTPSMIWLDTSNAALDVRVVVGMARDVLPLPEPPPSSPAGRSTGGLRLNGPSRTVITGGEPVPLTATEFAILAAMMDHPGRVLSRRSLLAAAGREAAGDRSADVYIAQLRAKVASAAVIRTVRGAGYALDPVQGGQ